MSLARQYDATDIVFGPKLSLACIGREALAVEAKAKRIARNLAVDLSVFDQEACASPHNVFIEKGGQISPEEFASFLALKFEDVLKQIPKTIDNAGVQGAVKSARMKHYLDGEVFTSPGLEWSVLYRDKLQWNQPVYGRTALVRAVEDLKDIIPYISRENQVIGLALPTPRRLELAEKFAQAGVDRITTIGHMADFTSPWDGIFPIDKLIRWVSLS